MASWPVSKINSFITRSSFIFLLSLIIVLGGFLRIYRYFEFPIYGETADEWAWAWLGASLWQTGQPVSWSYFKEYQEKFIYEILPNGAPLVTPDLDHPPLFGLLAGVSHSVTNHWRAQPSSKIIRLPMVILGCLNLGLLAILANKLFTKNKKIVLLATVFYASLPTVVFSSRLVVAENFLITLELLLLLLLMPNSLSLFKKNFFLILLSILAIMSKISGVIIPLTILLTGLLHKDKNHIKIGFLALFLGVTVLLIYAGSFNLDLFLAIQLNQGNRELGLSTLVNRLFIHPSLVKDLFVDGWLVFGLFALFSSISEWKKKIEFQPIMLLGLLNLGFIAFSAGERTYHGWYNYPVLPILTLALAYFWYNMIAYKNSLQFILSWLLLLPVLRLPLTYLLTSTLIAPTLVRSLILLAFAPLGAEILGFDKLIKKLMILSLILLILANILTVLTVNQTQYWLDNSYFSDQY